MAIDTRRCFWFGTEERSQFFSTPLQGADSSPSAWGVDGTLLNGGGYAFNSWGSHKRYSYEWPQSSSPETAQMMKSYRDGSFGRGLLYFLEPGIYRTNILPAAWADPSMALDNEAPSLVYGVDPVAVPTSGGVDLGLPVTSAQYNLSNTPPQAVPTPDTSVFLPVPTGHTLLLGAFYTATGSGGIFATPVNSNGTLGTAVKLTQKSNSDTEVVTDAFSGDIRGVRLWVARSDGATSSVTISAINGRLIETSDLPGYTAWVLQATNRVLNPGPSLSTGWTATGATNSFTNGYLVATSTYAGPAGATPRSNVVGVVGAPEVTAGEPYYLRAELRHSRGVPMELRAYFMDAAGVMVETQTSPVVTDTAQFNPAVVSGIVPAGATRMGYQVVVRSNLSASLVGDVYEARRFTTSSGVYFDGSTNPLGNLQRTRWTGAESASSSVLEARGTTGNPNRLALLQRGPWIGGQGHSGCRFAGTPSYVTNSPIEGGRVGFAASFIEVGSWVYG